MKVEFKLVDELDLMLEILVPKFSDERGSFLPFPLFNKIFDDREAIQFNQSISKKGVLRGLHHQIKNPQAKLVSCPHGKVLDLIYDNRKGSRTYGKYKTFLLDSPEKYLFVPKGFLHGFISLEDDSIFQYFVDAPYDPTDEETVNWEIMEDAINFEEIGVNKNNLIISKKDE